VVATSGKSHPYASAEKRLIKLERLPSVATDCRERCMVSRRVADRCRRLRKTERKPADYECAEELRAPSRYFLAASKYGLVPLAWSVTSTTRVISGAASVMATSIPCVRVTGAMAQPWQPPPRRR